MEKLLVDDSCMRALLPKLGTLAEYLSKAANDGKAFGIRYHNDCDGICAGLSVYRALKAISDEPPIISIPSSSAVIREEDALYDSNRFPNPRNTLLLILDHGANSESVAALKLLKSSGMGIIVIDHHPHDPRVEKLAKFFITPLLAEGNSSHTVGLMCYELGKLMDEYSADANLAYFSMQADKSSFALKDRDFKEAVAIDYLATNEGLSLQFYDKALKNREVMDETYLQAKEKLENALASSENHLETFDYGPYFVVIAKVSKFLKKGEYPPRGKIMNEIIAKKERDLGGKPLVCLGVIEDSISFRANKPVMEMGFDANKIIQQLKLTFGSEILNGGGHSAAAALQANSSAIPLIEREILVLIGQQLNAVK
ncbi:MAG TPA: DHH family phosphoesterase [Candidatus Norongarragalinales archaeon]|nr:DHH family phosphoesterase [Candidatus Norongarragalinales archaeon]